MMIVVGTEDGRKHVVRGREALMLRLLLDVVEEIAATRHGTFWLRWNDEKITPELARRQRSVSVRTYGTEIELKESA